MNDRRLSEHFMLSEFLASQYAARFGIDMTPPPVVVENLMRLCATVLEPLRATVRARHPRAVLMITSGYRPPALNLGIGGARNSAHLTGRAADVVVPGVPAEEVFACARMFVPAGPPHIDKAILEFGRWVHLQVARSPDVPPRGQFLVATRVGRRTVYSLADAVGSVA